MGPIGLYLTLQLGREGELRVRVVRHLSASCGLVETGWFGGGLEPTPSSLHQAPGTGNDATDASQHENGRDETSTCGQDENASQQSETIPAFRNEGKQGDEASSLHQPDHPHYYSFLTLGVRGPS